MIGLEGVSAQAFSDTIGAIYDCALDPQRWPGACRRIADLCESTAGGICVHDLKHVQNDQLSCSVTNRRSWNGWERTTPSRRWRHRTWSPTSAT